MTALDTPEDGRGVRDTAYTFTIRRCFFVCSKGKTMLPILQLTPAQRAGLYRLLSAVICLALILGVPGAGFAAPAEKNDSAPLQTYVDPYGYPSRSAIVHLFEWKWIDIAKECTNVLGPKGYKAVQVSPPSEHAILTGVPLYYNDGDNDASNDVATGGTYNYPWWQRYQTVGLAVTGGKFTSRSGNLADFTAMISACHEAGVEVYVDAIVNHSTNQDNGGVGSAGTSYSHYDTEDYSPQDYHQGYYDHCPNWDIPGEAYGNTDWGDEAVRICELNNLADLITSDANYVQPHIRQYLNSLISIGVDGFRIDAAKHMYPSDIQAIIGGLNNTTFKNAKPYLYLEVIGGDAAVNIYNYVPVTTNPAGINYSGDLNVTEFVYGKKLSEKFKSGLLADLETFGYTPDRWEMIPDQDALVFVNNHDNQRGHGSSPAAFTYKDGQTFALLNVFMLAWPFGDPSVMSSYEFDIVGTDNVKYDGLGPPSNASGLTESIYITATTNKCALGPTATTGVYYYDNLDNRNGWVCEHSWKAIANMAGFRAWAVQTADANTIHDWWDNGSNQIAFGVNNKGFVIINKESSVLSNTTLSTGLPDGAYCNVILGELNAQKTGCTGETITVTDGAASFTVPANSAVAIHVGQKVETPLPTPPTVSSISPVKATYGISSLTLTVTGSGFTQNTSITWNEAQLFTTYVNSTTLKATLASANLGTSAANITVSVSDPEDGAAASSLTFQVIAPATFSGLDDKGLDGQILESGKDKNTGGTTTSTGTTINIGDDAQKRELRGIFSFNTAATLPDNAVVVKAELKLYCTAKTSTMNLGTMYVDGSMAFNNNTTLEAADWQAATTYGRIASLPTFTASQWHTFNLAQFGSINLSNTSQRTQFRLYFPASDNDTKADTVTFASGDNTTSSNRPQLTVYYYVP